MQNCMLLLGLWTTLLDNGSFGRLITQPVNEAPMWFWYNHSINCSSSFGSAAIRWYFIPVDETTNVTIAVGSTVYPVYEQLYRIEQPTPYASNLIFPQPSNSTAGTYVCADREMMARAESVVIYEFPTSSELPTRSISNGDLVNISCTVHYLGNRFIEPIFNVYDIDDVDNPILLNNISSPTFSKEGKLITATASFVQTAFCPKLKAFRCNIFFGKPKGKLSPGSATNAPNHVLQREFLAENVSCFPYKNNITIVGAVSGGTVSAEAILTCNVTSFPSANYSWTDLKYGNSSSGPHLTVWHDGSYKCTASNYFNEQWHWASKIISNLTVERLDSRARPLHGPIEAEPEIRLTIRTYWQQLIKISADYYGNKLESTLYSDLRRRENTLFVAPGNNYSSPSNRVMRLMRNIIKTNVSSVTLNMHYSDHKQYDYICLRYRIPTTHSHQMYCFQPDLHTLGFIMVVSLITCVFFIHRCCWRIKDRHKRAMVNDANSESKLSRSYVV